MRVEFLQFCRENLEEADFDESDEEFSTVCPFCDGGRKRERSFDVNLNTGAWRCWRSNNCGEMGNHYQLVEKIMGVDRNVAFDYLKGDRSSPQFVMAYIKYTERYLTRLLDNPLKQRAPILATPGIIDPISETEYYQEILEWIELERGYEVDWFLENHDLFYDDGAFGRVAFQFESGNDIAYQLYAYLPGIEPKTLNPDDQILSKTFYGWNKVNTDGEILLINEGIFDSSRMRYHGLDAVCGFGTSLSDDQIVMLALCGAEEICFMYDNGAEDKARRSAKKVAEYCKDKTISFTTPERKGADPDELTDFDEAFECLYRRTIIHSGDKDSEWGKIKEAMSATLPPNRWPL